MQERATRTEGAVMPTGWTTTDIPDQHGRMALVTGANTGIGFHQALELARKGAHVLLAARDPERGRTARSAILQESSWARTPTLADENGAGRPVTSAQLGVVSPIKSRTQEPRAPRTVAMSTHLRFCMMRLLRAAALSSAAGGSRHGTAHRALCRSGPAQGQRHCHHPDPLPSG